MSGFGVTVPATVQPQVDVSPQPLTFSKDMSNEQLAQWLSNHPNLTGTDYQEDISKLKGTIVFVVVHEYTFIHNINYYRSQNKWLCVSEPG